MIDEWSGFADLLANLIEKYAEVMELDKLPDPEIKTQPLKENKTTKDKTLENTLAA